MKRSVRIDIYPDKENRFVVINAIRLYRAACRKAYAACSLSEMAGSEISVKAMKSPNTDDPVQQQLVIKPTPRAKKILSLAYEIHGKAHLYELRGWIRELHPSWLSFIPESIHRDMVSPRWRAKDPEFPQASRGFLTLNGARAVARFVNVGIYFKNTVFKLDPDARKIVLKWDRDLGPIEFKIGKLDLGRYNLWRNICAGKSGWKAGGIYLTERDGKIFLIVSYECPDPKKSLLKRQVLTVKFTGDIKNYITISSSSESYARKISCADAVALMEKFAATKARFENQLSAAGVCRRHRKIVSVKVRNLSLRRVNAEKDFNHVWSRAIINRAIRDRCATIIMVNRPEREFVPSIPWSWNQFETFLNYKISEIGGQLKSTTV